MYKKEKVVVNIKVIYTNKPINEKKSPRSVSAKAIGLLCVLAVAMLGIKVFCAPGATGNFEDAVEAVSPQRHSDGTSCLPVFAGIISSPYSVRQSPLDGESYEFHRGVDITSSGDDNIYSYLDGVVSEIGSDEDYGNYIEITHTDGTQTLYAHCNEVFVQKEQNVGAGQIIAEMGDTGATTGKHLHFEMRINGKTVNPLDYLGYTYEEN